VGITGTCIANSYCLVFLIASLPLPIGDRTIKEEGKQMPLHETVSAEYVSGLCNDYYTQALAGNKHDARSYAIAVGRTEHEWTRPEVETELNIRLTMGYIMRVAPGAVQFTEGY
jgi:hypothetical protein